MTISALAVDGSSYAALGYITVTWNVSPSAGHYSWKLYRQNPNSTAWTLVNEFTDAAASYNYKDYYAPEGGTVTYGVTETTAGGGTESAQTTSSGVATDTNTDYWLVHPTDHSQDMPLYNITGDDFATEYDQAVIQLIGRGRKIDQGDNWGRTGTLSGKFYGTPTVSPRQMRLNLEAIKASGTYMYLRTPFGDIWKVGLGDLSFSRVQGVGTTEYVTYSIPYFEVA